MGIHNLPPPGDPFSLGQGQLSWAGGILKLLFISSIKKLAKLLLKRCRNFLILTPWQVAFGHPTPLPSYASFSWEK